MTSNKGLIRAYLSVALTILFLSTFALAQTDPSAAIPDQAIERLAQIKERLALTPEQTEQLKPIFTDEIQQLKALQTKYGSSDSRRSRMKMMREAKQIRGESDKKLKTVLSKQQMSELQKMREEWRAEMKARRKSQ